MVQDLRAVNEATEDIYPLVPNPYTLLAILPSIRTWYSVLDLKYAFFCIPLAPESEEVFAVEWQDPNTTKTILLDCPAPQVQKFPHHLWENFS